MKGAGDKVTVSKPRQGLALSSLPSWGQVPTTRECVGFGALQEVAVGLVQPASAVLYDYYNPGEHLGCFGKQDCGGWPSHWDTSGWAGPSSMTAHLLLPFSRSQVFCVLCRAHQEQAPVHLVLWRCLPVR